MTLLQYDSSMRMENMSRVGSSFVLLGLLEMERYWIICSVIAFVLYIIPTLLCCLIIYVIWVEESLHEPMYIFISNLLLNDVFINTVVLPQSIYNLLSGSSTITFPRCFAQTFFVQSLCTLEAYTFTAMAYDRYLTVGNPLRYSSLMTNMKAWNSITIMYTISFIFVLVLVIMAANLRFCGVNINNIFCDNMSLVTLACEGSLVNNIFGLVLFIVNICCILLIIVYCYIRTLLICLKTSRSPSHKAIHTLVTHIVTFSVFMTSSLFVILRYRLSGGYHYSIAHSLFPITGILTPIIVNPIVYGLRTEALKVKLIRNLQKINAFKNVFP